MAFLWLLSLSALSNPLPPIVDEANWLPHQGVALLPDIEELQKYGGVTMRIWVSPSSPDQPNAAVRAWVEAREAAPDPIVALGIFPTHQRVGWYVGRDHRDSLRPSFLDRVVQEILNPALADPTQAVQGAIGAVALKSGYSLTRWTRPASPSGFSVLALLALGIGAIALGTYWAISLFKMGPAGAVLFVLYLSFGLFAYLEWFLWMGALGTGWAVVLLILSRFTSIRLPTHPESPEPTRAPEKGNETESQFNGGRAAQHW